MVRGGSLEVPVEIAGGGQNLIEITTPFGVFQDFMDQGLKEESGDLAGCQGHDLLIHLGQDRYQFTGPCAAVRQGRTPSRKVSQLFQLISEILHALDNQIGSLFFDHLPAPPTQLPKAGIYSLADRR